MGERERILASGWTPSNNPDDGDELVSPGGEFFANTDRDGQWWVWGKGEDPDEDCEEATVEELCTLFGQEEK